MLTIYGRTNSVNVQKVLWCLAELALPYERIDAGLDHGKNTEPWYLALNPNGRVPTLELDDGTNLAESDAILWYLAEGSPFVPGDRLGRAQTLQWMFFEQYSHEPYVATPRYIVKHLPADHPRRAELPARLAQGRAALAVMDEHLGTRRFFVAERYTIADISLYAYTHVAHEGGHDLTPYENVRSWLGRVAAQPRHVPIYARPQS